MPSDVTLQSRKRRLREDKARAKRMWRRMQAEAEAMAAQEAAALKLLGRLGVEVPPLH